MGFHVSTQAGVVRQTERYLHTDPPTEAELEALADDVRAIFAAAVPEDGRARVRRGIAVAGTATQLAAIAQRLQPYDPARVHGYVLTDAERERILRSSPRCRSSSGGRFPGSSPTARRRSSRGRSSCEISTCSRCTRSRSPSTTSSAGRGTGVAASAGSAAGGSAGGAAAPPAASAQRSADRSLRPTSAHSAQTASGIAPTRISSANTWQPRQIAKIDSSPAAIASSTSTTSAAVWAPKPSASTSATVENAVPIPWANRFGGPGTGFEGPSRGAITFWASAPSGLSVGPVRTRAQKPYASGISSQ